MTNKLHNQRGSILLSLIIIMPSLFTIVFSLMSLTVSSFKLAQVDKFRTHAQFAADAGLDLAVAELNEQELLSDIPETLLLNNPGENILTSYEVVVTPDGDDFIIKSTGRSYRGSLSNPPESSVSVEIFAQEIVSGENSVVSGFGGLIMNNTSSILGGGGLYINGFIEMNGNGQIGESTDPVNLFVANQRCPVPADATYPRICNPGEFDNPISMNHSQAYIYGDVRANGQSAHPRITTNGVVASSGVTAAVMPVHDRSSQKAAVVNNQTGNRSCSNETWTIPANTKINGNVVIGSKCDIIVEGDVWITGNLTSSANNKTVTVANSATIEPVIMVDGSSGVNLEKVDFFPNATDVGLHVLAYWCSDFSINDCSDVTGTALASSGGQTRIRLDSGVNADGVFFYARWSRLLIRNTAQVGAVAGQAIELDNSTGITSATTVGEETRAWVVRRYLRSN